MGEKHYVGRSYNTNVWGRDAITIPGEKPIILAGQKSGKPYRNHYFPVTLEWCWLFEDGVLRCNWSLTLRRRLSNGEASPKLSKVYRAQFGRDVPSFVTEAIDKTRPKELTTV